MILTGSEIKKAVKNKKIIINPFEKDLINPNSYNYRLGSTLNIPRTIDNIIKYELITMSISTLIGPLQPQFNWTTPFAG